MFKQKSGIALILTVGILAILAMVAVGFSTFARLELQATANYSNQLKAEFIAEAGISQAIDYLKNSSQGAGNDAYDHKTEDWYYLGNASAAGVIVDLKDADYVSLDNLNSATGDGVSDIFGGGSFKLKIIDCGSLININTPLDNSDDENDFENILVSLGLNQTQAQNLIAYRKTLPGGKFTSKEEIKLVRGIAQDTYTAVKDFITLFGDADAALGHTNRVFINVNTASGNVLYALLRPLMDDQAECNALITAIITRQSTNPFDGSGQDENVRDFCSARGELKEFLKYQQSLGVISQANLESILLNTDPNNNSTQTSCFGFDSNGYYEIEAIGVYRNAQKRIKKTVNIFHKLYYTLESEFNQGTFMRCTSRPNVPVNIAQCYSGYNYIPPTSITDPNHAQTISNAIKPGFWDDFEDVAYSSSVWNAFPPATYYIEARQQKVTGIQESTMLHTGDLTITTPYTASRRFPKIVLGVSTDLNWQWGNGRIIMRIEDETDYYDSFGTLLGADYARANLPWPAVPFGYGAPPTPYPNDGNPVNTLSSFEKYMNCGWLLFKVRGARELAAYIANEQNESGWTMDTASNTWFYYVPNILSEHLVISMLINTAEKNLAQYYTDKTLQVTTTGTTSGVTAYWAGGSSIPEISRDFGSNALPGQIALFGMDNNPSMDNVRIIPAQSYFTSHLSEDIGNANWGTIRAAVTVSEGAQIRPADSREDVSVYLTTDLTDPATVNDHPVNDMGLSVIPACGGPLPMSSLSRIQFRAYLMVNLAAYNQIPILEDITITYLPKTEIMVQNKN